ncbi:hypothetical protein FOWG_18270 [Fusarium oxysporum f. sp. lycopersici MN25]|nr:hypothetical protein FOWG_18270 [Fusarium oxysporum f. sp. lycopersici MN25]
MTVIDVRWPSLTGASSGAFRPAFASVCLSDYENDNAAAVLAYSL